jgi:hypothetical protein
VRATVFDGELLSNVSFGPDDAYNKNKGKGAGKAPAFAVTDRRTGKPIASFVAPPPEVFEGQLNLVDQYAELRDERSPEILSQLAWPYAYWWSLVDLRPDRTRYTLELLDVGLRFAASVHMRIKHALHLPRPIVYSPQVQPLILTPGHGSLPSGHATEGFLVAAMLRRLLSAPKELRTQLRRQAARIAANRVVAGVHFPVDSMAGRMLGETLAEYVLARCGASKTFARRRFLGPEVEPEADALFGVELRDDPVGYLQHLPEADADTSPLLAWLWKRARGEWS